MLNILISIIGIIITILLIIGLHEFGHFITARLLGIKVLRFSIGFGKALRTWRDKTGTEYVFAAIPLGGYVRMLDETEGKVDKNELKLAFNRQPLYKKFLVVMAGPLSNFILAFLLYWFIFMAGFTTVVPMIGGVTPHSIAAQAGLKPQEEIVSIDNIKTTSWMSVIIRLLEHIGDNVSLPIMTQKRGTTELYNYSLNLNHWHLNDLRPDPLDSIGIVPYEPKVPPVIGFLKADSPAAKAHLQVGDKVIAINKQPINDWLPLITMVAAHPAETLTFSIQRNGKTMVLPVEIGAQSNWFGPKQGFLGIAPHFNMPSDLLNHNKYGPFSAAQHAWQDTTDFIELNFLMLGKMLSGKISYQSLGGPISIFQGAGSSLEIGILPFLSFIAFISIAIGVINVLPIPGLDGGHLLIYIIEFIIRRPISVRAQELMFRLGFILLIVLAIQAIANDIMRIG